MTSARLPHWRIGIDVGGTFTDLIAVPADAARCNLADAVRHKVPSTPRDPAKAVEHGLHGLAARGVLLRNVAVISHGTTLGLNAILQRRGARVALLTSAGHRDILQIARARLPRSFDLHAAAPRPAVPRERVIEIADRFAADGTATGDSGQAGYLDAVERLRRTGPEAVAVSLVGGYAAPRAEARLAARLTDDLGVPVTSAATVWPQAGEYERTTLAVLDAQITPLMSGYLTRLSDVLHRLGLDAPLYIAASNGGTVSLASALQRPIQTVLSGPAAGVAAAARLWPGTDTVTIDMGGTSCDIGILLAGRPILTTDASVGGYPLVTPVVEITAIGAGGGSVLWVDDQAARPVLRVGPVSAGADPGPAAYGHGGAEPTVTDADLHTGLIAPDTFLGGALPLSADLAADALARSWARLGGAPAAQQPVTSAADATLRIASAGMATRLRTVIARHGEAPERFTLVAFGGAGGTHAALLATEVGAHRVIVPAAAATFCALGAAITPVRRDFVRTVNAKVDDASVPGLDGLAAELASEGLTWFSAQGRGEPGTVTLAADLKYDGQPGILVIPLGTAGTAAAAHSPPSVHPATAREAFAKAHRQRYGFADPTGVVVIKALRLSVTGAELDLVTGDRATLLRPVGTRRVRHDGRWHEASICVLASGDGTRAIEGPAVIERTDTSVFVPPGWTVTADSAGNLHLTSDNEEPDDAVRG